MLNILYIAIRENTGGPNMLPKLLDSLNVSAIKLLLESSCLALEALVLVEFHLIKLCFLFNLTTKTVCTVIKLNERKPHNERDIRLIK